jgi:hypothetical protein
MDEFEEDITAAIIKSDAQYLKKREAVIVALEKAYEELKNGTVESFSATVPALCKQVQDSVDQLDIVKDSAACTFTGSIHALQNSYALGKRTNKRKEAKYNREVAVAEKRAAGNAESPTPPTIRTVAAPMSKSLSSRLFFCMFALRFSFYIVFFTECDVCKEKTGNTPLGKCCSFFVFVL